MPIPSPREGEKEKEFISRCMSAISEEDRPNDQKLAICYDKWRGKGGKSASGLSLPIDVRRLFQVPLRGVEGKPRRIMSYAAIWGDEDHKDLYDTWFTPETEFCLDWYDKRPALYDHGFNKFIRAAKIGEWRDSGLDDYGLFFLGELDEHFRYLNEVEFLMELGYLFPSSGTMSHLMRVADDGWIQQWPIAELSSTAAPAEWRIPPQVSARNRKRAALALRTLLGGLSMPDEVAGALFPGVTLEAPSPEPVEPEVKDVQSAEDNTETEDEQEATDETLAPGEPEVEAQDIGDPYVAAIQHLDQTLQAVHNAVQSLAGRVEALEQDAREPVATQVAHLVDEPTWVRSLWSVSRSGRAIRDQDVEPGTGTEPLGQDAPLLTQLSAIGGDTPDPNNVLGTILASQRRS